MQIKHVWLNEWDQPEMQYLMDWTRQALMTPASRLQGHLQQLTAQTQTPRQSWLDLMASTALQAARE
ncbi:hypothetical protein G6L24_08475 [Agrobacterium tumefaciens]|uniref:hypothetical protein n=1 Tax=Agrobacterium tumefaciens TaxID=358 RepID=UPI002FDB85F6|nr:hypothetical protein [Agrobacterium tumefaciens]